MCAVYIHIFVCVTIERKKRPINRSCNRLSLTHKAYILYIHFSSMGPINKFSPIRTKKKKLFFWSFACLFLCFYSITLSLCSLCFFWFQQGHQLAIHCGKYFCRSFKIQILCSCEKNPTKSIDNILRFMRTIEIRSIFDEWNGKDSIKNRNFVIFFLSDKKKDKLFFWSSK